MNTSSIYSYNYNISSVQIFTIKSTKKTLKQNQNIQFKIKISSLNIKYSFTSKNLQLYGTPNMYYKSFKINGTFVAKNYKQIFTL